MNHLLTIVLWKMLKKKENSDENKEEKEDENEGEHAEELFKLTGIEIPYAFSVVRNGFRQHANVSDEIFFKLNEIETFNENSKSINL